MGENSSKLRRYLLADEGLPQDLRFFREECAKLQGQVAILTRENLALRARVAPLEARIVELELLRGKGREEPEPTRPQTEEEGAA